MNIEKTGSRKDSDEYLIRTWKSGDLSAFEEIVRRHQKMVLNLAYRMVNDFAEAEDLSQEGFLRAYLKIDQFRGESTFRTWLYKIVINVCRSYLRKRFLLAKVGLYGKKQVSDKTVLSEQNIDTGEIHPRMVLNDTTEQEIEQKDVQLQLEQVINMLSGKQKEVFILKHVEGLTISDIANILNSAEGTIKSHLSRAVKNLRGLLKERK